jgi:hypothetical protein
VKRYPLSLYVTRALKDELVQAARLSGRALTAEIEARLQRSLAEDHGNLLDLLTLAEQVIELVRRNWAAGTGTVPPVPVVISRQRAPARAAAGHPRTEPADDQHDGDREADRKWFSGMLAEHGKPGEVGRLLPAELGVERGNDGPVVTVRQEGIVHEIPLSFEEALQVVGDLYEASGPDEKRAILEAFGLAEKDERAAAEPERKLRRR